MSCVQCGYHRVNRPRGLCYRCYYTPGVKERTPSISKFARRSYPDFFGPGREPEPTDTLCGTPQRLAVLIARAARGEQLSHPQDARRTG